MLDLDAIEARWKAQMDARQITRDGQRIFNEDVPALIAEVRRLGGIIQADQERLTQAALRVGLHWGCDTPDAMADAIQEWQAETCAARKQADELEAALSEQSEMVQREWLSPVEKEGWRQEIVKAERQRCLDAVNRSEREYESSEAQTAYLYSDVRALIRGNE